jgi:hypothetical protein
MKEAERGEEGARRALERIRGELGPEFETRIVEDLFFLATDGGERALESAAATIRRMVAHLYATYFERRPKEPVRIFCFKDGVSYAAYVRRAYGREPSTPYGYYLSAERKMILNLGTGTGTLAHELVHPLIAEDFPSVPAWLNEGFASLFEHSYTGEDGRVRPRGNWRLWDLSRAMREGREVPLTTMMETNTDEFYGDERGVNYATARYFCLNLERKNLLAPFYREFRATAGSDPTGKAALEKVTGATLAEFEKEWRKWVAGQR